ncbi:MAG TPA: phasin family protein [Anaeromyxobacteraceae bacterium]|nr:phasin family protein [Anaeromyxobacteraceae bacterium]
MTDIQEMFKEAWSQALVGLNAAEAEAEKVLTRLGFSPDDVRRHAREFGERLTQQRREVEKAVDDAVRRAAARFRFPTRDEMEAVRKRLDEISERLDALAEERSRGP